MLQLRVYRAQTGPRRKTREESIPAVTRAGQNSITPTFPRVSAGGAGTTTRCLWDRPLCTARALGAYAGSPAARTQLGLWAPLPAVPRLAPRTRPCGRPPCLRPQALRTVRPAPWRCRDVSSRKRRRLKKEVTWTMWPFPDRPNSPAPVRFQIDPTLSPLPRWCSAGTAGPVALLSWAPGSSSLVEFTPPDVAKSGAGRFVFTW